MEQKPITAVGIDVSKGKSVVAACQPGGTVLLQPFTVEHTVAGLKMLVRAIQSIQGDVRVVMEHTGTYWYPLAAELRKAGIFVSVVNALLIHHYGNNLLRKVKTDKSDSLKIAKYALAYWGELREYDESDETRRMLKIQTRLYQRILETSVSLRNGLIALADQAFPGVNRIFRCDTRTKKDRVKWVDFVGRFWHKDCVLQYSRASFEEVYRKWCKRNGYRCRKHDVSSICDVAASAVTTLPRNESAKTMIKQAVDSLNAVYDSLEALRTEIDQLASLLPEYRVVMAMHGVGHITGPMLMAEIGDVLRFKKTLWLLSPGWMHLHISQEHSTQNQGTFQNVVRRN